MTKRNDCIPQLLSAGISHDDALALRRISMTLHRWHEMECGDGSGCIERENVDGTGRACWHNSMSGHRHVIPDRETGARKRLAAIMSRYPTLQSYVQADPRGAALYILRPGDVLDDHDVDSCYSRGLAVYK